MFFEVLCSVSFCGVKFVGNQLDNLLNFGVVLEFAKEDKLDVLVALQTLGLLVSNIKLEYLLYVSLYPLAIGVLHVRLHHNREE